MWLTALGALPQEGAAEAKMDMINIVSLDKDLHNCLDARPSEAILVPTFDTMVELSLVAEAKMVREEAHMAQQRPGMLWRLAPQDLTNGWHGQSPSRGRRYSCSSTTSVCACPRRSRWPWTLCRLDRRSGSSSGSSSGAIAGPSTRGMQDSHKYSGWSKQASIATKVQQIWQSNRPRSRDDELLSGRTH